MTQAEYIYCTTSAEVVRLDIDPEIKPDVVAAVHHEPWASKVKETTGHSDFDIIIDEISWYGDHSEYYQDEAAKLLVSDGLFYGWFNHKKVVWINTEKGLMLSE